MKITLLPDTDLSHWYDGTQHYACEDGRFIAVHADKYVGDNSVEHFVTVHGKPAVKRWPHVIVLSATVILWCDERGHAESLTPAWQFAPGTTIYDALTQAGFELSP